MNTFMEKFGHRLERVKATGCLEWRGGVTSRGYGSAWIDRRCQQAHRAHWEAEHGPLSRALVVDHLCRNRRCVELTHLEPVTPAENSLRGVGQPALNARKTHCGRGHPFDARNTYINPEGSRICRACNCENTRRYQQRLRERVSS